MMPILRLDLDLLNKQQAVSLRSGSKPSEGGGAIELYNFERSVASVTSLLYNFGLVSLEMFDRSAPDQDTTSFYMY